MTTTSTTTAFTIETRLGAPTFTQLVTRVTNLEAKLAAYRAAGAEPRHTRRIELALADAHATLGLAL